MHTRDRDYAGWASEQAALLRAGRLAELDIDHLIAHLLKWQFQPDQRGNSWRSTIRIQRDDIADLLTESPSLKREVAEKIQAAYPKARELTADETRLLEQDFPRTCPYSEAELLNPEFWPE